MEIRKKNIDRGSGFDFGRVSEDYAKYRDIYPPEFYQNIADRGLCISGQTVLDIGTGTGVLPRNMYRYGARFIGADISPEQIDKARELSLKEKMDINFLVSSAEELPFENNRFDVITACQCFFYFDSAKIAPIFHRILKQDGKLVILYMAWFPFEDRIAQRSEEIVLKYSPDWTGAGETEHPILIDENIRRYFTLTDSETYRLKVHFTRDQWHGRMKTCRGIGASLSEDAFERWDKEHYEMLKNEFSEEFDVLHYTSIAVLTAK